MTQTCAFSHSEPAISRSATSRTNGGEVDTNDGYVVSMLGHLFASCSSGTYNVRHINRGIAK